MILQSLEIKNFKNYSYASLDFCDRINFLVGINGSGKTNILDAIYYLSASKSAFSTTDTENIKHDQDFFVVNGEYLKNIKLNQIHCSFKRRGKKMFKVNEVSYEKLSQHVGKFPVVMIAPNDDELIRESNDKRRKFFDSIISQSDNQYLTALIKYNHFLKQRNALLKQMFDSNSRDQVLLGSYDEHLIELSRFLSKKRREFLNNFMSYFNNSYNIIADQKECVMIDYVSKAESPTFQSEFKSNLERDILTQRTNTGIHKDEYQFKINDLPVKKYGSQGQQKSFLVSLKLAQFDFIKKILGITPILLFDDIFDKLDEVRISKLLQIISSDNFQQIFITDARAERTQSLLNEKFEPFKIFQVEGGKILQD